MPSPTQTPQQQPTSTHWLKYLIALFSTLIFSSINLAHAERQLVTSTHPLYLIAQAVTAGIESPQALLRPDQHGHHIHLTPQHRQQIEKANLVLWIGSQHEAPLAELIKNKPSSIALLNYPNTFHTHPMRQLNTTARLNSIDPHLWLDPYNAIAIAHFIAHIRAQQYPADANRYLHNAQTFTQQMTQTLINHPPLRPTQPYWAYHDAYQYLETSIGIRLAGAVTSSPELAPSAQQLTWLQQHRPNAKPCLLTETATQPSTMQHLSPINSVRIDEQMSQATTYRDGWLLLRRHIHQCLQSP